jgi:hypothetical protein
MSEILKQQEFYILKWDNKYGPFSYLEVIKMLQSKSVFEFDYIWKPGQENWMRIADMQEFEPSKIHALFEKSEDPEIKNIFFRRRHERVNFNGSIIIHDNEKVWKGEAIEISEGGAGIVIHNAMINPGEKIYLHFKPGDAVPPFNAICEVVSKKFSKDLEDRNSPVKYGVKFLKINSASLGLIKDYIKKAS